VNYRPPGFHPPS